MAKFKFIDLFAGLGGFRLAFEANGGECVFSSEIDNLVAKTYALNFQEFPAGDITKIDETTIPDHDILCAGFPCQAFSIAGRRKGFEDTRGTLFFDVARILNEKRPKAFILENVKGITNHDSGNTLRIILTILTALGYKYSYEVLNAKDYGIPQNRERWYCIGLREDLNIPVEKFKFPKKQLLKKGISEIIQPNIKNDRYEISEICKQHVQKFIKEKNIEINNKTLAYEVRPSRCQFKTDDTSPCLTAKMGTGGNNIPIIVSQMRKLTEEECLQIMGYPKTYKIGTGHTAYKQIGNSVVVPLITLLAKELTQLLEEYPNKEVPASKINLKEIYKTILEEKIVSKEVSEQLCIFP